MNTNIVFVSVQAFKDMLGVSTIEVVKNPNTGKLFLSTSVGNFKCQQDINPSLPMSMLHDKETGEYCLVNSNNDNSLFRL